MAYYNKESIQSYALGNLSALKEKGLKSITPKEELYANLENESDVVGFFWMDEPAQDGGIPIMQGKVFIRIDFDLYTDDRFAVDQYQAFKNNLTVSELIKKNKEEAQKDKEAITPEQIEGIKKFFQENVKRNEN
jgi:hypothetical protein